MVPLAMVMRHEIGDGAPKVALTERDHAMQALLLDRSHEALRIGVAVWRLKRRLDHPDFLPSQELQYGATPLPIAITNQYAPRARRRSRRSGVASPGRRMFRPDGALSRPHGLDASAVR